MTCPEPQVCIEDGEVQVLLDEGIGASPAGLSAFVDPIAASATETFAGVDITVWRAVTWWLVIENKTTGDVEYSTVQGKHGGGGVEGVQYGIIGDFIDYDLDVVTVSGELLLSITNNESDELRAVATRIQVAL